MQRGMWTRILRKWVFGGVPRPERKRPAKRPSPALRTKSASSRIRVRPQLEGLEDRTLLNAYVVNVLGDNGGVAGVQSGPFSGNLRWCINQADLPANNGSTITFDPTVFNPTKPTTIALSNGELPISNDMTITNNIGGPGTIIISGSDGNGGGSRVFDIIPNTNASGNLVTVTITGLTIANGNAAVYYTSVAGNQGGDIFNGGNLILTNDIVENGFSVGINGGPAGRGGGIFNAEGQNGGPSATLTLNNTIVENNTARGSNGLGAGGGVYNDISAKLVVTNGSQFLNNRALGDETFSVGFAPGPGEGGGIYNKGILQLNGAATNPLVFTDNLAQGGTRGGGFVGGDAKGGGVYNSGLMTLQYVDFYGNQAQGGAGGAGGKGGNGGNAWGGGIFNASSTALFLPNVTFSVDANGIGNQAIGGPGGVGGNGASDTPPGLPGGDGGAGGNAQGGAVASTSGGLVFKSTSFISSQAIGDVVAGGTWRRRR